MDQWKAAKEGFVIGAIGPPLLIGVPGGFLLGLMEPAASISERLLHGVLGAVSCPLATAPLCAPLMALSAMLQAQNPVINGELSRAKDGDLQFVSSELHCPISLQTMQPDLSGTADGGAVPSGSYLLRMQANQQLAAHDDNPHEMALAIKFDAASQRAQQAGKRLRELDESPQDLAVQQKGRVETELADGSHELLIDQWTLTGREPKRLESGDLSLERDAKGTHLRWADGDQFLVAHTNRSKTETQIHVLSKQRRDELEHFEFQLNFPRIGGASV